jgi:Xaa-Pro aminopeptidase
MRLRKEPAEIAVLERSCEIAAKAHREARAAARPGRFEYEVEAVLVKRFLAEGAAGTSYHSIVAAGENATILHYVENSQQIAEGDLVLVDAGCEYLGYASDITRTFPASGKYTRPQKKLNDVVLAALKAATAKVQAGLPFEGVDRAAKEVLVDGLVDAGLLKGKTRTLLQNKKYEKFTLHRTSHWLGLDVHDRGRYAALDGSSRALEPGMVLTVEPGLYVRPDEKNVPSEYLGIGIRVEDDVVVTEGEPLVLTEGAPKEA